MPSHELQPTGDETCQNRAASARATTVDDNDDVHLLRGNESEQHVRLTQSQRGIKIQLRLASCFW